MKSTIAWLKRQWQDRRRVLLLLVTMILASASVTAAAVVRDQDGLPDGVVLRMGKQSVTEKELDQRVRVLRALYGIERPAGGKELSAFNRDAARATALSLILDEAARKQDTLITDRAVDAALDELIATQYAEEGTSSSSKCWAAKVLPRAMSRRRSLASCVSTSSTPWPPPDPLSP